MFSWSAVSTGSLVLLSFLDQLGLIDLFRIQLFLGLLASPSIRGLADVLDFMSLVSLLHLDVIFRVLYVFQVFLIFSILLAFHVTWDFWVSMVWVHRVI